MAHWRLMVGPAARAAAGRSTASVEAAVRAGGAPARLGLLWVSVQAVWASVQAVWARLQAGAVR